MNDPQDPCTGEIPLPALLELFVLERQLLELRDTKGLPPGVHASLRLAAERIDKALQLIEHEEKT